MTRVRQWAGAAAAIALATVLAVVVDGLPYARRDRRRRLTAGWERGAP